MTEQEKYMKAALKLAQKAADEGEVPVGGSIYPLELEVSFYLPIVFLVKSDFKSNSPDNSVTYSSHKKTV